MASERHRQFVRQVQRHELETFLDANQSIRYLRLHWTDLSGVLRARIVPFEQARKIAEGDLTYTLAQNCMVIPVLPAPQAFVKGPEIWELIPDWTSLRPCGQEPEHATVMCFTAQRGRPDPFCKCPRALLKHTLSRHPSDVVFKIGIELEFIFLDQNLQTPSSVDKIKGQSTMAGLRGSHLEILKEIGSALKNSQIQVYHMHTEGRDQLEIALDAVEPVRAIDDYMYAAEIIRTIGVRYGLRATLTPKPILTHGSPHNGLHIHMSCSKTEVMRTVLAASLTKLPALCAMGIANIDGYDRIADDEAGRWIGYGTANRDLPIRQIDESHFEFRFADATANMYLFAAAILQLGLTTPSTKPLEWSDCPVQPKADGSNLAGYGITQQMPISLTESLTALRDDDFFKIQLGKDLHEQYINIKMHEVEYAATMNDEARRQKFLDFF